MFDAKHALAFTISTQCGTMRCLAISHSKIDWFSREREKILNEFNLTGLASMWVQGKIFVF